MSRARGGKGSALLSLFWWSLSWCRGLQNHSLPLEPAIMTNLCSGYKLDPVSSDTLSLDFSQERDSPVTRQAQIHAKSGCEPLLGSSTIFLPFGWINLTRNPISTWNPGFLLHVVETLPPSVDGLFSETHVGVEFVDAGNVPWTCLIITTRGAKVN